MFLITIDGQSLMNAPESTLEKQYDAAANEAKAQELWQTHSVYTVNPDKAITYSVDTPPPTVSGNLHIGHVFSYTQTDILVRFHRMHDNNVLYPFGFDDNGLATERFVEKKREIRGYQLPRPEFIKICLEETQKAQEIFKQLWTRIGLSVDWSKKYSTIDARSQRISQQSFLDLLDKGYVYRRDEPALYCTTCRTSVAQAELDDKEKPSTFYTIAFADQKGNDLLIATTRPELLPAVVAVFYHPSDTRYQYLEGTQARVPHFNFMVPILPDKAVIPEKGTGLVMCSTFGDKTDIDWYLKHNLPYKQVVGLDGKWTAIAGELAGLTASQARTRVVELLTQAKLIKDEKPIVHVVNIHERCQNNIEYVILKQWFVKTKEFRRELIEIADKIEWYPGYMKSRYIDWVTNISWDWCISRQRFYGIPFPIWYCNACNRVLKATKEMLPVDPTQTAYPNHVCHYCGSNDIIPDTDVMDTWNTSSLTPYICSDLVGTSLIPMSMRPQAHDIIRTWAFYTILKSWMHDGTIPWKSIVISGHVLSGEKEKISKSKGNNPLAPENLLQQHSADAIRFWTASGRLGTDISFSENQLKIGGRLITKLWNAFRFLQPHISNITNNTPQPDTLGAINEWLLHHLGTTFAAYTKRMHENEFSLALDSLEPFFWNIYCDNYLELIKNQLFNPHEYTPDVVHATQWTLYTVGLKILQLYAPFIPHITEHIYQLIYKQQGLPTSLHQTMFDMNDAHISYPAAAQIIGYVVHLLAQVRKLKSDHKLSLKAELQELHIVCPLQEQVTELEKHMQLIRGVTHAHVIAITTGNAETPHIKIDHDKTNAFVYIHDYHQTSPQE